MAESVLASLRRNHPPGIRVKLIKMVGEGNMPAGMRGVVENVDDAGQIHVRWENGSSLAIIPTVDSYEICVDE